MIIVCVAFVYPLLRYAAVRLYIRFRLLFGARGGFCMALKPFPTLLPGCFSQSPDLAYYIGGDLYLFKFYAFRRRRKWVIFGKPYEWTVKNIYPSLEDNPTFSYHEGGFADRLITLPRKIKAPRLLIRAAGTITEEASDLGVKNVIPCLFFAPSVRKMTNARSLRLEPGDTAYFGSLIITPAYLETLLGKYSAQGLPLRSRLKLRAACIRGLKKAGKKQSGERGKTGEL